MVSFTIAAVAVLSAFAAWFAASMLVRGSSGNAKALDDTWGGLRKVHVMPTPRIGGIAVAFGLVAAMTMSCLVSGEVMCQWSLLLACAAPAFVWGLIEDLTKRGAAFVRYALTAMAAALGFVLLDARIVELDLLFVDDLLLISTVSFLFTVFAVTGVSQSFNLIDGLNGLAGVVGLFGAVGIAVVAAIVGDSLVFPAACALAASLVGFLLINFPRGRIFLGDGGAYLVGLLLAELSVLLVFRNSEVSPWFPLLLLAYPIWETLFTVYRRKARGGSALRADALHLHSLVYRRVVRWRGFEGKPSDYVTRNSIASMVLWIIPAACFVAAVAFWDSSLPLQLSAVGFGIFCTFAYLRLVRFRVPAWLVLRAGRSLAKTAGTAAEARLRTTPLAASASLGQNAGKTPFAGGIN